MDPSIYLVDDEHKSPSGVHAENKEINPALDDDATVQIKNINAGSGDESNVGSRTLSSNEGISADQVDAVSNSMASMDLIESISGHRGWFILFVIVSCYLVPFYETSHNMHEIGIVFQFKILMAN